MIPITSFQDLDAWFQAKNVAVLTYQITTKFPKSEILGLTNQMRRASISISSNIAEGFSRKNQKEKRQFYYVALGSNSELQSQTIVAQAIHYLNNSDHQQLVNQITRTGKLINGLIRSLNNQ